MKNLSILFSIFLFTLISSCSLIHLLPSKKVYPLKFKDDSPKTNLQFVYLNPDNNPESKLLIEQYKLDSIAGLGDTELDSALLLLAWTNSRWEHSGSNRPSDSRTLTILKEAKEGNKFRCVEYGIVLRSVLSAVDIPARTLSLKSRDVEKVRIGAGHVATEAWSSKLQKWFFLDGQFNVIPTLDGLPLNSVEFQDAIISKKNFKLIDSNGEVSEKRRDKYLKFVSKYLYYFDFMFDQRNLPIDETVTVNEKEALMLVPLGAENPDVFQRKYPMDYYLYTNNRNDFYLKPD